MLGSHEHVYLVSRVDDVPEAGDVDCGPTNPSTQSTIPSHEFFDRDEEEAHYAFERWVKKNA